MSDSYVSRMVNAVAEEIPNLNLELVRLYALLGLIHGEAVSCVDVHDAWSVWMLGINQDHRSLVPFSQLSRDVQDRDTPYRDAIQRAVRKVRR